MLFTEQESVEFEHALNTELKKRNLTDTHYARRGLLLATKAALYDPEMTSQMSEEDRLKLSVNISWLIAGLDVKRELLFTR